MGLETAFPVLYTQLVRPGVLPLDTLIRALCVAPRRLFGLPGGALDEGADADLAVLDLNRPHMIAYAGDSHDVQEVQYVEGGQAYLFTSGGVQTGRWEKGHPTHPIRLYTDAGEEMTLNRGIRKRLSLL